MRLRFESFFRYHFYADVAHSGERDPVTVEVVGSKPIVGAIFNSYDPLSMISLVNVEAV